MESKEENAIKNSLYIQNLAEYDPEQHDLTLKLDPTLRLALLWAGGWTGWPPEEPSNLNYSDSRLGK